MNDLRAAKGEPRDVDLFCLLRGEHPAGFSASQRITVR